MHGKWKESCRSGEDESAEWFLWTGGSAASSPGQCSGAFSGYSKQDKMAVSALDPLYRVLVNMPVLCALSPCPPVTELQDSEMDEAGVYP